MTLERNQSQFWRVETYRKIVKETDKIHQVRVYNTMAQYYGWHVKTSHNGITDCTHYEPKACKPALDILTSIMIKYVNISI